MSDPDSYWVMMIVSYSYYVMLAILFSTARRRNGYSGFHDLITGSRVILRSAYVRRPTIDFTESPLPEPQARQTIGPYHVLDSLQQTDSEEFLLAYDTRLLRRVWIRKVADGSPSISSELRNLGRVGRLRWINGRRASGECWDAYEALSGKPLLKLLAEPQEWANVRYWLMDLAYETSVAEQDGTMPHTLSLDRVWITAEGRAKLLDFSAPGTATSAVAPTFQTTQQFLFQVAASALQGRIIGHQETCLDEAAVRLPVKAHLLIDRLGNGQATPAEVAAEIKTMTGGTPSVTRLRRVAMLMMIGFLPLFIAAFSATGWLMMVQLNEQQPEIVKLRNCLAYMDAASYRSFFRGNDDETNATDDKTRAFEIYIAGTFRETIEDKQSWNSLVARTIALPQRARAQQIIAEYPEPTEQALLEAAAVVEPILHGLEKSAADMNKKMTPLAVGLLQFVTFWILFVAVPGMIAAIAFRRGLVLRMFGVDHVVRNGCPASRWRLLWRSIVFNSPVLLGPILLALVLPLIQDLTLSILLIVGLVLAIAIISLLLPQRGIPDRLSGTYPVPS